MNSERNRRPEPGKRRNRKRLRAKSGKKRAFIFLLLGVLVAASLLFREPTGNRDKNREKISEERLRALPYLSWTPAKNASESGITIFEPERSYTGINIYKSGDMPEANLMNMKGDVLHTWTEATGDDVTWSNVELTGDGDLLVFVDYERIIKLDWDSNILWQSKNLGLHHDLSISADGDIYTLARRFEYIPEFSLTHLTANDYITILSDAGEEKRSISIADLLLDAEIPIVHEDIEADYPRDTKLRRSIERLTAGDGASFLASILRKVEPYYEKMSRPKDYFHTNAISIIDTQLSDGTKELSGPDMILICIRNQNLIAIVDLKKEEIVWSWGANDLEHPHDPVVLSNGNILLFDNGYKREYSRIVELDPATREIVWEYQSTPPDDFYSETRGSNQELSNGNILIADSRNGRAFEITRDGDTVWEFYNPDIKKRGELIERATIFHMRRLESPDNLPNLNQ